MVRSRWTLVVSSLLVASLLTAGCKSNKNASAKNGQSTRSTPVSDAPVVPSDSIGAQKSAPPSGSSSTPKPTGTAAPTYAPSPQPQPTTRTTPNTLEAYVPAQTAWADFPSLPGAQYAIFEGDPKTKTLFTMRLKFPDGFKVMPHTHPGIERVTVIAGVLNLGSGPKFDDRATTALPAGSFFAMPPGMQHFAWAKGETILQLTGVGPWEIDYVNASDDPRKKSK